MPNKQAPINFEVFFQSTHLNSNHLNKIAYAAINFKQALITITITLISSNNSWGKNYLLVYANLNNTNQHALVCCAGVQRGMVLPKHAKK